MLRRRSARSTWPARVRAPTSHSSLPPSSSACWLAGPRLSMRTAVKWLSPELPACACVCAFAFGGHGAMWCPAYLSVCRAEPSSM
eukprot:11955434-Alexandrium_andersonii.AAC.1